MHSDKGCTALCLASGSGQDEVVELLLEAGADNNARSRSGNTGLCLASHQGHVEVARLRLEAGADKSLINEGHLTARSLALRGGHTEVVQLLEAGARDTAPSGSGRAYLPCRKAPSFASLAGPGDGAHSTVEARVRQGPFISNEMNLFRCSVGFFPKPLIPIPPSHPLQNNTQLQSQDPPLAPQNV